MGGEEVTSGGSGRVRKFELGCRLFRQLRTGIRIVADCESPDRRLPADSGILRSRGSDSGGPGKLPPLRVGRIPVSQQILLGLWGEDMGLSRHRQARLGSGRGSQTGPAHQISKVARLAHKFKSEGLCAMVGRCHDVA